MVDLPEDEFDGVEIDFDRVLVNAPYRRLIVERLRRARLTAERRRSILRSVAKPDNDRP